MSAIFLYNTISKIFQFHKFLIININTERKIIMPLPLIPVLLGGASLIASVVGVKKGLDAKEDFERAERIGKSAQRRHENAVANTKKSQERTTALLVELGTLRKNIATNELREFIEKVGNANLRNISREELDQMKNLVKESLAFDAKVGSLAGTVASGALAGFGATGSVGLLATASTGTAISSLAGAAATNATLAWFGGGALAAGGLGMAGGTAVLGGLVAGPALAVGGFMLANKAEEALEKARDYETKADRAIADLNRIIVYLDGDVSGVVKKTISSTKMLLDKFRQCPNEQMLNDLYEMIVLRLFDDKKRSDGAPCLVNNITAKLDAILNRY